MKQAEIQDQLGRVDLFAGLSKRALKHLVGNSREVEHTNGDEVIAERAGAVGFHLILEGTARVSTGPAVRRDLGPGDYFGEISVIDGKPRSASVKAVEGLRTLAIQPLVVRDLIESNPKFAHALMVQLCSRIREADARG